MARKHKNGPEAQLDAPDSAPTNKTISIGDVTFPVPTPYTEGHTCNAVEASVLNQTLSQNLRNNFAPHVKKAQDTAAANGQDLDLEALREKFASYAEQYVFSERRAGRGPIDPVEREALKMAKESIRAACAREGISLKAEETDSLANQHLRGQPDNYYPEAKRRVESKRDYVDTTLNISALRAGHGIQA